MNSKQKSRLIRITVSLLIFAGLLLTEHVFGFEYTEFLMAFLYAVPFLTAGYDVLIKAAKNISHGQVFDENFLMIAASIGAYVTGEYSEAAAVMIFYQTGELFQNYAVGKSRESVAALMDICPEYANLETDTGIEKVDPDEVEKGSIILIKPGERIPLDAEVTEGSSYIDTSALTGESVPRRADPGDSVFSGCINGSGTLRCRTVSEFEDSMVSKVLEMVENASSRKSRAENFITKFAKYYTPVVTIGAVILAVVPSLFDGNWWDWVHRACTFLVISCPCALVISVPMGFFGGIGAASREGILIKGSNYFEVLNSLDTMCFDKTGTLTRGSFEVTAVYPAQGVAETEVLAAAAKCEKFSNHPVAAAIIRAYDADVREESSENAVRENDVCEGCSENAATGNDVRKGSSENAATENDVCKGCSENAATGNDVRKESLENEATGNDVCKGCFENAATGNDVCKGSSENAATENDVRKESSEDIAKENQRRGYEEKGENNLYGSVYNGNLNCDSEKSDATDAEELPGKGIKAKLSGKTVLCGNRLLMEDFGIVPGDIPEGVTGTVCYTALDGKYIGAVVVSDSLKDGVREGIDNIKRAGVRSCVMLTGDLRKTAEKTAEMINSRTDRSEYTSRIDTILAELLPQDKVSAVEKLIENPDRKGSLGFAGDGVNDAPVLTRADIGFAMGSLGSAAAIEAADVVIMDDDIGKIGTAVAIARKTIRIVRQNIVFALAVKVIVLVLGALGLTNLWAAVFADVGVAVLAILNSMRTLRK